MEKIRYNIILFFVLMSGFVFFTKTFFIVFNARNDQKKENITLNINDNDSKNRGSIYALYKNEEKLILATQEIKIKIELRKNIKDIFLSLLPQLQNCSVGIKNNQEKIQYFMSQENPKRLFFEVTNKDLCLNEINILRNKTAILESANRLYPLNTFLSNVIGFVGSDGVTVGGQYGVEKYYEDKLVGESNTNHISNLFLDFFSKKKKEKRNLFLTIEPNVELKLENMLKKVYEKYTPEKVGAIVINPENGEIYGMSSFPNFNPNTYSTFNNTLFSNFLVENIYEFGSIMKPLTIAFGIDSGAVHKDTVFQDDGFLELNGRKIYNFDKKGRGKIKIQDILNKSLNTGSANVALLTGKKFFLEYLDKARYSNETGIDLPNEGHGILDLLRGGKEIELATSAYGHGIATTPIAMARALSALANKGKLPNPHIVKYFENNLHKEDIYYNQDNFSVIKKETADEVTGMLVKVVDEYLAHKDLKNPKYTIAAKTGTALLPNPKGGYYEDKFLHSFFGYFPASRPKFLVLFVMIDPKGVTYASETLSMPFKEISDFLLDYYNIEPDR